MYVVFVYFILFFKFTFPSPSPPQKKNIKNCCYYFTIVCECENNLTNKYMSFIMNTYFIINTFITGRVFEPSSNFVDQSGIEEQETHIMLKHNLTCSF